MSHLTRKCKWFELLLLGRLIDERWDPLDGVGVRHSCQQQADTVRCASFIVPCVTPLAAPAAGSVQQLHTPVDCAMRVMVSLVAVPKVCSPPPLGHLYGTLWAREHVNVSVNAGAVRCAWCVQWCITVWCGAVC
jgi:hypothetical protein